MIWSTTALLAISMLCYGIADFVASRSMLLERMRPYLENELVPAIVDEVTPHIIEQTAPRVIDGAQAARITTFLSQKLEDAKGLLEAVP